MACAPAIREELPMPTREDMLRTLDALAAASVLVDSGDVASIGALRGELERLLADLEESGAEAAAAACALALDGLRSSPPLEEVLRTIGDAVTAVRACLEDGDRALRGAGSDAAPTAVAAPAASTSTATATSFAADPELVAEFVTEAREHVASVERDVLRMDRTGERQDALNGLFRSFHTIKGVASLLGLERIAELARAAEELLDGLRSGRSEWSGEVGDLLLSSGDALSGLLAELESGRLVSESAEEAAIVARLRQAGEAVADRSSERSTEAGAVVSEAPATRVESAGRELLRVDPEKLDLLLDTLGELSIGVAMMERAAERTGDEEAVVLAKRLEKTGRQLHEIGSNLRMVPLRSTFRRMGRLVRSLSRTARKPVSLVVEGEDCEVDRSMVEHVTDPLVHILRNAVGHGIEDDASARVAAGKPEEGRITLRAYRRGSRVSIEVEDDGRGIDRDAVLERGRALGLLQADAKPPDQELWRLIFEPGFSTARAVSDVSGRGVGMDVVRRDVEQVRGLIEIDSRSGVGTLVRISLPLTIATIDGMVVRVGDQRFVLPTQSILRSLRPAADDIATVLGRGELVDVDGRLVPLGRLSRLFGVDGACERPEDGIVMVIDGPTGEFAILVDELVGQQQTVVKGLGREVAPLEGFAGGAILSDGRVALILDMVSLQSLVDGAGRAVRPAAQEVLSRVV